VEIQKEISVSDGKLARVEYKFHPLAELLPPIAEKEFSKLVKDIHEHGLIHPIVTHEGLVLDGRHRFEACAEVGIEPRFVEFSSLGLNCSVEDFIWSSNVTRRHLTGDQRTMMAAKFADAIRKLARERQKAGLKKGDQIPVVADSPPREKTREAIAKRAEVSEHKARQAEAVRKKAP
jgi:hypothetical protein